MEEPFLQQDGGAVGKYQEIESEASETIMMSFFFFFLSFLMLLVSLYAWFLQNMYYALSPM